MFRIPRKAAGLALLAVIGAAAPPAVAAPAAIEAAAPVAPAPLLLNADDRALLAAALKDAPGHGLTAISAEDMSDAELESAVISYAGAMRGQRMNGRFPSNWALRPEPYDAADAFARAFAAGQVRAWLNDLAPPYEDYRALVRALARYRAIEAEGGWPKLAGGPVLRAGDSGPRVAELRRRIAIERDVRLDAADAAQFDAPLAQVLRAEQARLGVPVTGELDKATAAAFNVPVEARIAAIEANLERWRWRPRNLPAYRVEVNVADARLTVLRGGETALAMRIIVGRKSTPTPMFLDEMETVVFNPPWNVPDSIARKEILPKAAADPNYLAKHHYVRLPSGRLQQLPGPDNALGKIKFDLPNQFAVYLHDTPARSLFDRDMRALSHGCMRVEKPLELARLVLGGQPAWDAAAIDAAIAAGETKYVALQVHPAVVVDYRTAFVADGQVNFRDDVYGWDDKLKRLLAGA